MWCEGFSLLWSMGSRGSGFSSCSSQALEHRLNTCGLQALLLHSNVGSSWIKDRSHVSCISRQILYHWATREALLLGFWRIVLLKNFGLKNFPSSSLKMWFHCFLFSIIFDEKLGDTHFCSSLVFFSLATFKIFFFIFLSCLTMNVHRCILFVFFLFSFINIEYVNFCFPPNWGNFGHYY